MSAGAQHIAMVWQTSPPAAWPEHYSGVCVKVTDGLAFNSGSGYSWAANYGRWVEKFGQERIGAWSVAYPQDGERLGANIAHAARGAGYVILDVEDFSGVRWSDAAIRAVVGGVKKEMPHASVGYSTYPTRAQAAEHHINQQLLDELCDFAAPQVYYPYQRDRIAQIDRDHRHASWIVAPNDDEHWTASVKASLVRSGRAFYWRAGMAGWETWPGKVAVTTPDPVPAPPKDDPLRPKHGTGRLPAVFVAWDGSKWYLTNVLYRNELSEDNVRAVVGEGFTVQRWDAVTHIAAPIPKL